MKEWDGDKANDYFISLLDRINLEGAKYNANKSILHKNFHDIDLANHDLYYECAKSVWTKERFATFLEREKAIANSDSFDTKKYLDTYQSNLNKLRAEFKSGELLDKILAS